VGLLFFAPARRQWQSRPKQGETTEMPKWMSSVDHFGPGRSLVLGLALSATNLKNLVLTVAGSVTFFLVASDEAARPLAAMKDFMAAHRAVIMMVLFLVLGAKILGDGLGGFGR